MLVPGINPSRGVIISPFLKTTLKVKMARIQNARLSDDVMAIMLWLAYRLAKRIRIGENNRYTKGVDP